MKCTSRSTSLIISTAGVLLLVLANPGAAGADLGPNAYARQDLVSDQMGQAPNHDPNLVNAWGVAFNPNGFVWVANGGTGKSTLYDGNGVPQSLVVTIAPQPGGSGPAKPTGLVFNSSDNFVVSSGGVSRPSRFIFATEDGTISGWNPEVKLNDSVLAVDNSRDETIYKGLALGADGKRQLLYATDFHNNRIDVFDPTFAPTTVSGGFQDPSLPAGFAPFGIQNLNGNLYVTYAKQDDDAEDDVAGPGLGYVNVFDPSGNLIRRLASEGTLNAPWGLAIAPANFAAFSNTLLVGNFGDGKINAFDAATGELRGTLLAADGKPLEIDGLWGMSFGNGINDQPVNVLFFAAGPGDEEHGLYGRIAAVPEPSIPLLTAVGLLALAIVRLRRLDQASS